MKLLLFAVYMAFLSTPAELVDGKCSACQKWHVESRVSMSGGATCTALYCGSGYYDERGIFHGPPACNTCTAYGSCSRGHSVIYRMRN